MKPKMKKLIITAAALALISPLSAAWKLVNNGNATGWTVTRTGVTLASTEGTATTVDSPTNASAQGKVLRLYPGVTAGGAASLQYNYTFALPEGQKIKDLFPAANNTSTLYFKMLSPLVGGAPAVLNMTYGMMSAEFLGTQPVDWSWGNYSVLTRNNNFLLDQHNGTTYVALDSATANPTNAIPQSNVWYEYWIVINRTTNRMDGYIKGGQWASQTKVWSASSHRLDPQGKALDTIVMRTSNDGITGVDALIFDDFFVDNSGTVNLSTPGQGADGGASGASGTGKMVNIATRGPVGTGSGIMIAGFVLQEGPRRVLIRGVGPTLGGFGVSGALVDPVITLFQEQTAVETNDNWGQASNAADIRATATAVGAFALAEGGADAALLLELPAGAYTVHLSGKAGSSGVALIEVYEVR